MEGIIIKNISNDYTVRTNNNDLVVCKPRGKFRNDKLTPLVGDKVVIDKDEKVILEIKKRKNELIRPRVANIDQAIIVTSVKHPDFDSFLLDKLLTIISFNNIKPIICFTKLDLLNDKELETINNYMKYYEKVGYIVTNNQNKQEILSLIKDKVTVFTGQSGVGKSSLLNILDKNLELKTNDISYALNRGKHTTRHTELFEVCEGFLVDTPGFSCVDFNDMTKLDIRDNMNEMFDNLDNCKYRDCLHIKEDGCYVKQLVEEKEILESRYENYKNFLR